MVLVHGYGGSGTLFYKVIRGLTENFHVIVIDLIGMGSSSRPTWTIKSGDDADAYKVPRIPVFSLYGLHHATSLMCVLASLSQSRRNNSSPSCSNVHVPAAPVAGELLRGGDSADYVANWGSKGVRGSHSALVLRAAGHLVVHLCRMLSNV